MKGKFLKAIFACSMAIFAVVGIVGCGNGDGESTTTTEEITTTIRTKGSVAAPNQLAVTEAGVLSWAESADDSEGYTVKIGTNEVVVEDNTYNLLSDATKLTNGSINTISVKVNETDNNNASSYSTSVTYAYVPNANAFAADVTGITAGTVENKNDVVQLKADYGQLTIYEKTLAPVIAAYADLIELDVEVFTALVNAIEETVADASLTKITAAQSYYTALIDNAATGVSAAKTALDADAEAFNALVEAAYDAYVALFSSYDFATLTDAELDALANTKTTTAASYLLALNTDKPNVSSKLLASTDYTTFNDTVDDAVLDVVSVVSASITDLYTTAKNAVSMLVGTETLASIADDIEALSDGYDAVSAFSKEIINAAITLANPTFTEGYSTAISNMETALATFGTDYTEKLAALTNAQTAINAITVEEDNYDELLGLINTQLNLYPTNYSARYFINSTEVIAILDALETKKATIEDEIADIVSGFVAGIPADVENYDVDDLKAGLLTTIETLLTNINAFPQCVQSELSDEKTLLANVKNDIYANFKLNTPFLHYNARTFDALGQITISWEYVNAANADNAVIDYMEIVGYNVEDTFDPTNIAGLPNFKFAWTGTDFTINGAGGYVLTRAMIEAAIGEENLGEYTFMARYVTKSDSGYINSDWGIFTSSSYDYTPVGGVAIVKTGFTAYTAIDGVAIDQTDATVADVGQASFGCDGDNGSRWESKGGGELTNPFTRQYILNMGASYEIDKVAIIWEGACASNYTLDVSADGETWTTVDTVTAGTAGLTTHTFTATTVQYIRVNCTQRALAYGYSFFEITPYAPAE